MRRAERRRAGALLALPVAALLLGACGSAAGHQAETVGTQPPRSTSTVAPTTTAAPTPGVTWPLTGAPAAADAPGLHRPAVVVKIDNDPAARPQIGLNQADLVYELRVEGISRLAAVFHSTAAAPAGPIRSARTSDPDLVASLRTPLVAWSGGNPTVRSVFRKAGSVGVLLDAGHDAQPDLYWRDRARRAPHNLFTNTADLAATAPAEMGGPSPLFRYAPADRLATRGEPAAGVWVAFSSPGVASAEFVWDADRKVWRRFQVDRRHPLEESAHVDANGVQVAPTNVVVLEIDYRRSAADVRSPEAVTLGTGPAMVLTGGRVVRGTWHRAALSGSWGLVDEAGTPVQLAPGRTWVELVQRGDAGVLDPARAFELLVHKR